MSLDIVFDELDVSADPFALCELQGRCTLGLDSQTAATLHYILAGEGELLLPGHAPIRLGPGTVALCRPCNRTGCAASVLPDILSPSAIRLSWILQDI